MRLLHLRKHDVAEIDAEIKTALGEIGSDRSLRPDGFASGPIIDLISSSSRTHDHDRLCFPSTPASCTGGADRAPRQHRTHRSTARSAMSALQKTDRRNSSQVAPAGIECVGFDSVCEARDGAWDAVLHVVVYHNRMIDALCNLFTPSIESPNTPPHLVRERDVSR